MLRTDPSVRDGGNLPKEKRRRTKEENALVL